MKSRAFLGTAKIISLCTIFSSCSHELNKLSIEKVSDLSNGFIYKSNSASVHDKVYILSIADRECQTKFGNNISAVLAMEEPIIVDRSSEINILNMAVVASSLARSDDKNRNVTTLNPQDYKTIVGYYLHFKCESNLSHQTNIIINNESISTSASE